MSYFFNTHKKTSKQLASSVKGPDSNCNFWAYATTKPKIKLHHYELVLGFISFLLMFGNLILFLISFSVFFSSISFIYFLIMACLNLHNRGSSKLQSRL